MKQTNLLKSFFLLCALIVGSSSVWGQGPDLSSMVWSTPIVNENFNSCTAAMASATKSSVTNYSSMGEFNCVYNNNTSNKYGIENNTTLGSNALKLSAGSNSPVISAISGKSFATKGAYSFKITRTSKCYIGLFNETISATPHAKAKATAYLQQSAGALSICDGSGWVSVGSFTSTDVLEICVIYNSTESAASYGDNVSLAAKKAHIYVNGTCVMDGENPKAFTIPGVAALGFRVAPLTTSGNVAIVDDVKIYDTLPTAGSSVATPTILPDADAVEKGTTVTITTDTDGAALYYTTDGSDPTSESTLYNNENKPVINTATTIKAIAIKNEESSGIATVSYTIKKVEAPTFSIESGTTVPTGTIAELETTTEGATIYYTTNGDEPTTSSDHGTAGTSSASVNISAAMTIRAIAVKDNWDNSDVTSATYTVITPIPGLAIDFEASSLNQYTDWEFNNVGIHTTTITAHGGEKYGSNVNNNDNATETAYIKTKNKIEHPGLFTCYISKESKNTTTSNWSVQISENGSSWTNAGSADATSMTKGNWNEFTVDLSEHSNVYVRLYYSGSNAVRAVDDIVLTESDAITVTPAGLATYASDYNLDFSGVTGIKAYKASIAGKTITFEKMDEVPVGEGMLIRAMSTLNENTTFYVPHKASASQIENAMKRGEGTAVAHHPSDNIYNYVLSGGDNGVGFYQANGETVPRDHAYLQSTAALAKGFVINYDDEEGEETDGIKAVSTKVENGVRYNLAGQKVGADYKGIVIVNGKKYLNK